VSNSTFSGNSAFVRGAIYNWGGTLVVASSTISGNSAGTSDALGSGAGIFSDSFYWECGKQPLVIESTLSTTRSYLSPMEGTQGGSALTNFSGEMTVTRCTLSGNFGTVAACGT